MGILLDARYLAIFASLVAPQSDDHHVQGRKIPQICFPRAVFRRRLLDGENIFLRPSKEKAALQIEIAFVVRRYLPGNQFLESLRRDEKMVPAFVDQQDATIRVMSELER
jgi:hypothetical protein